MKKRVVIESELAALGEFGRWRQGYFDGYESEVDPRMPHDKDYMSGFIEGRADDSMGLPNRLAGGGQGYDHEN